nr:hypothetical protein L204_02859 [Cryptococcus depauperatus CBS 7855]
MLGKKAGLSMGNYRRMFGGPSRVTFAGYDVASARGLSTGGLRINDTIRHYPVRAVSLGYMRPDAVSSSSVRVEPSQWAKNFSKAVLHNKEKDVVANITVPGPSCWNEAATYTVQWDYKASQKPFLHSEHSQLTPDCQD